MSRTPPDTRSREHVDGNDLAPVRGCRRVCCAFVVYVAVVGARGRIAAGAAVGHRMAGGRSGAVRGAVGVRARGRAPADPGATAPRARAGHDLGRVRVRDPAAVRARARPRSIYVSSSVIADATQRVSPLKILFNAAQYLLAIVAAAGVLLLAALAPARTRSPAPSCRSCSPRRPRSSSPTTCWRASPARCWRACRSSRYLRDDLAFQAWTAGCVLAFAPALLASADASVALVPVCFVPMLAVYFGGRQAALSSHRAHHDALTGLPNRSSLSETLQEALDAAARERPRGGGDAARPRRLQVDQRHARARARRPDAAAGRAAGYARRWATATVLARIGGDEFAVLIDGTQAEAEAVGERLLEALDDPLEVDSVALHIRASIGIACFPQHGRTSPELIRHADVAMYCAKDSDAAFHTYAEADDEYSIDRLALAAQLRRGIERGELVVHYQPKVPLQGGATLALEALVRWNHPQLGCIGPDGFIPLAEQTGIIKPLTEKVLEASLEQCKRWRREGLEVTVSVNVSTRSLLDHDLLTIIGTLLGAARPGRLGAAARDHREPDRGRPAARAGRARGAAGDGRDDRDRRLRDRLLVAVAAPAAAGRRDQDRPLVRDPDGDRSPGRGARALDHRPRPQPRSAGHGRGRRDGERQGTSSPSSAAITPRGSTWGGR